MKTFTIAAAVAALAPSIASASVSTYSQTDCVTYMTTKKPSNVPTKTLIALTLPFFQKVTTVVTPTSTVTPSQSTVTATATSTASTTTTISQVTDTFTATSTFTETDFATTTLVSTDFTTSTATTTSSSTSTIPASAGFTPLASVLTAAGYQAAKKRRSPVQQRAALAEPREDALEARAAKNRLCLANGGPQNYPASVVCNRLVELVSTSTVTSTARTTSTITAAAATTTTTSTAVVSTTITVIPVDASTTVTESTSTTITSVATASTTTTSTVVSTSTIFAPLATSYAACASNNLISSINGMSLTNGYPNYGFSQTSATNSAYDCCVLCQTTTGCGSVAYDSNSGTCFLVSNSGACNGAEKDIDIATGGDTGLALTYSNSNCGQAFYDGVETQG